MGGTAPQIRVVSAEIQRDGCYLITQRSSHALLPLLWEFPGGRVLADESDTQALERAVMGRLGCRVVVEELLMEVDHAYDSYHVVLVVYRCRIAQGEPCAVTVHDLAWVGPDDFADYPFPGADQKTVEALLDDD